MKLTKLATFDTYKNLHDELIKTGQGTIFNFFNPIGISGDNLQSFNEIIDSIWSSDNYTSRSTIERYCIDVIQAIHIDGEFWLNNSRNFDIGIFKYKKWKIEKGLAISEGNFSASFNESGSYRDIDISTLTNSPTMSRIWDIMTKYIQETSTQIENRLINAIRWVGMANSDDSNVTKYVQYVFALEALLSHRKRKELITPGIAHKLAEFAAFIIGENVNTEIMTKKELRKRVFHEVKSIYDTRSQIVHGNEKKVNKHEINKHEINRARKIIYSLIFAILQNDSILKLNSMDELEEWIEDLKFSS